MRCPYVACWMMFLFIGISAASVSDADLRSALLKLVSEENSKVKTKVDISEVNTDDDSTQTLSSLERMVDILNRLKANQEKRVNVPLDTNIEKDLIKLAQNGFKTNHLSPRLKIKYPPKMSIDERGQYSKHESDQRIIDKGHGSMTSRLTARNWHTRNCAGLMQSCLGWYRNCCKTAEYGGLKFDLKCSFENIKTVFVNDGSGICVPDFAVSSTTLTK